MDKILFAEMKEAVKEIARLERLALGRARLRVRPSMDKILPAELSAERQGIEESLRRGRPPSWMSEIATKHPDPLFISLQLFISLEELKQAVWDSVERAMARLDARGEPYPEAVLSALEWLEKNPPTGRPPTTPPCSRAKSAKRYQVA